MNKFIGKIKSKKDALNQKMIGSFLKAKSTVTETKGEMYIDTIIKIIIAVVVGALILAGVYYLIDKVAFPALEDEIKGFFSFS